MAWKQATPTGSAMIASSAAAEASSSSRWRGRIAVSCRMRPLLDSEAAIGVRRAPWILTDRTIALGRRSVGRPATAPAAGRELGERAGPVTVMDAVFGERVTTREVYERSFREIVAGAAEGLNGAIMAYGQTSSGKTFSISGGSSASRSSSSSRSTSSSSTAPPSTATDEVTNGGGGRSPREKGIIHYALEDLFAQLCARKSMDNGQRFAVYMSYCEVYMERVNDLLREGSNRLNGQNLPVKEDAETRSFYVEGLRERSVGSAEDVIALLAQAEKRRRVACTRYNEVSSRSHTLLTLVIECSSSLGFPAGGSTRAPMEDTTQVTKVGRLVFVDLAGNERVEAGAEYMAEGNSINKSLFFLGKVIERLAACERRGTSELSETPAVRTEYLPVRDSNLTRLLSLHLGGNSRTGLLVTLTPAQDCVEESLSTLRFAQKASTIRSIAQPVFVSKEQSLIHKQQETIAHLHQQVKELQQWQRQQQLQQQQEHHVPRGHQTSGPVCRVVQQLREENSRLRSSIRYMVEERNNVQNEHAQNGVQDAQDQTTCKRSDGTGWREADERRITRGNNKLFLVATKPPRDKVNPAASGSSHGTGPPHVTVGGTRESREQPAPVLQSDAQERSGDTVGSGSGAEQPIQSSTPSATECPQDAIGGHAIRLLRRFRNTAECDAVVLAQSDQPEPFAAHGSAGCSKSNPASVSGSGRRGPDAAEVDAPGITENGIHPPASCTTPTFPPASSISHSAHALSRANEPTGGRVANIELCGMVADDLQARMSALSSAGCPETEGDRLAGCYGVGVGNPLRADRLDELCLLRPSTLPSASPQSRAPPDIDGSRLSALCSMPSAHRDGKHVAGLSRSASVPTIQPGPMLLRPVSASSRPLSASRRRAGCSRSQRGVSAGRTSVSMRRSV